jgi:hypothetical protein
MRHEAVGWIGVVLLAAAGPMAAAPLTREPVRLRAAGIELARLSPLTFELMTQELSVLLEGAEVRLDWRTSRASGETAPDELRVVFLDSAGRGAHAGRPMLAASGQAGPAPTVWVYTPTVMAALGLKPAALLDSFEAQRTLGVALGRALAHEVVHLLAPEVPHGDGVMAARLNLAALDHARPALDEPSAVSLAAAARSWHTRGGPPPEAERRARARLAAAARADHVAAR